MSKRSRKPTEAVSGGYAAIPHKVADSMALKGASPTAKALLLHAIVRQHNGRKNGHLQLTMPWLKEMGWNSGDVVTRARNELIDRKLLVETRRGGLNAGPNRYALTWLNISDFKGLDIRPSEYHPGAYLLFTEATLNKSKRSRTVRRSGAAPSDGVVIALAAPSDGAKTGVKNKSGAPSDGDNVLSHSLPQRAGGGK